MPGVTKVNDVRYDCDSRLGCLGDVVVKADGRDKTLERVGNYEAGEDEALDWNSQQVISL